MSIITGRNISFADLRSGRRHTVPFADARRLSHLRRTHGVFRAYGGRTASFAPTADARRLSRLRRTHGVFSRLRRTHGVFSRLRRTHGVFRTYGGRTASFRAHGGRTASFAPTAFPKKANRKEFTFCSAGKALQKQVSRFIKSKKGEIHGSRTAG